MLGGLRTVDIGAKSGGDVHHPGAVVVNEASLSTLSFAIAGQTYSCVLRTTDEHRLKANTLSPSHTLHAQVTKDESKGKRVACGS